MLVLINIFLVSHSMSSNFGQGNPVTACALSEIEDNTF